MPQVSLNTFWKYQKTTCCIKKNRISLVVADEFFIFRMNVSSFWLSGLALPILKFFRLTLVVFNLSLNQTLLIFLLYIGQTWITQITLAISLLAVTYPKFEKIMLFICIFLQLTWRMDILLAWLVPWKLWGFSFVVY